MFPLKRRQLIRGAAAHVKAGLGVAADYEAQYIPFYIPFSGVVKTYWGREGGNWLRLTRTNGDRLELAHLRDYAVKGGNAVEGQLGGITGNSGYITTRPHLHIQIFNKYGVRLDPEKYNFGTSSLIKNDMLRTYKGTIYALVVGYWVAVGISFDDFVVDFGGQSAPEMTKAQFEAFPINKRIIK